MKSWFVIPMVLLTTRFADAQETWRFRWQAGKTLTYRVEQQIQAIDVGSDGKSESSTKLNLVKCWTVKSVDASGVAEMQHSLSSLRMEVKTPSGETILFDSSAPEKSDPKLREQMNKYMGVPLATLSVDGRGKVLEVKEAKFGPASRFDAEPPFVLNLPATALKAGQSWDRTYRITLEPPQGTGEKYDAVQHCTCSTSDGTTVVVALTTELKTQPTAPADRIPLFQSQPEGTIVFDVKNGRLHEVKLKVEKQLKGHAGEGSSYTFRSSYVEQFVKAE